MIFIYRIVYREDGITWRIAITSCGFSLIVRVERELALVQSDIMVSNRSRFKIEKANGERINDG
ncbi:hypothetical protein PL78_05155 [Yersinia entomophaga]|uniref:Uncharacterized protein n=1 Tax=Yersinia entomophaga TaxID=935293 RepID=A0ABN4PPV5_YERET|nr:hypothetical protein PL78_05155 [Yersinia entomophaga]OWF89165.1 hypothetical protein B4914_04605 [Yersinia entomophaga]